ncbi:MAG: RluA family pseudouridine synthase [Patescibacteria group bacterium]|nr:RluA family pseudouridine synthase [Patescibacteria group bacterium]
MELNVIYQDNDLLVADKPAGIVVFSEDEIKEKTLINLLIEKNEDLKNVGKPPRYGIVHRLDKDTSGLLLVAKNDKSLAFLQEQFKERKVVKKYTALVDGEVKNKDGIIETLIGRGQKDRKKQKVYLPFEPGSKNKRKAVTKYKILKKLIDEKENKYTLVEAIPITGRKHQLRVHFQYLNHPIVGDKIYNFKNQPILKDLKRQFLHAAYLRIKILNNKEKEFNSKLATDLKKALDNLKEY